MALPEIAVIVPARNAAGFLMRAVESVFGTGYPQSRVMIVEDGSTDETLEVANAAARQWPDRCHVLQHPQGANLGVSASRNLGIGSTTAEWIAFLDADDFYLPGRFEAFAGRVRDGTAPDALYEISEARTDGDGVLPVPVDGNADVMPFGIARPLTGVALLEELLLGRCWAISAITVRRSLLERTGGFPVGRTIAEDCDLWFRIAAAGRVEPGDLERPVSVYWRHAANTYRYALRHRVAMLEAMFGAWRYATRARCAPAVLQTFRRAVPRYLANSLWAAREAGDRRVALQMLGRTIAHRQPGCLLAAGVWRQSLRLPLDLLRGQRLRPVGREQT